jgi:hypothetical protein
LTVGLSRPRFTARRACWIAASIARYFTTSMSGMPARTRSLPFSLL